MDIYGHGGDVYAYDLIRYDFSVNLNPLGMPEAVKNAVCSHIEDCETYPDTKYRALRSAISGMEGLPAEQIICGNGAADLIYKLCLSQRPDKVLVCAPSFSEYERAARLSGAEINYHFLREENGFAVTEKILRDLSDHTEMVFLCSPNNPTGRLTELTLIRKIADRAAECGAVLVLDECFLDFTAGVSAKPLLDKYPNLVILKAFTKIYAMAGLRLGYMLSSDALLLKQANEFGQCWSVSSAAQYAGVAACSLEGFVRDTRDYISAQRDFLLSGLRQLGLEAFASDANFLLLRCEKPLKDLLLKKGILIRSCENFKGLDSRYYRVAVKTREANSALMTAMEEVLHG